MAMTAAATAIPAASSTNGASRIVSTTDLASIHGMDATSRNGSHHRGPRAQRRAVSASVARSTALRAVIPAVTAMATATGSARLAATAIASTATQNRR